MVHIASYHHTAVITFPKAVLSSWEPVSINFTSELPHSAVQLKEEFLPLDVYELLVDLRELDIAYSLNINSEIEP